MAPENFPQDALREVASIGNGHAARALGDFLGVPIRLFLPEVRRFSIEETETPSSQSGFFVVLPLEADVVGYSFVFLPDDPLASFLEKLALKNAVWEEARKNPETRNSFLKELGNILTGAYTSAVASFLNLKISPGVPSLTQDDFRAVWNTLLNYLAEGSAGEVLYYEMKLAMEEAALELRMYWLMDSASAMRLEEACRRLLEKTVHDET